MWGYVERQKLVGCTRTSGRARAWSGTMRPILGFALWLYAALEGIGSARELARMTSGARRLSLDLRRPVSDGVKARISAAESLTSRGKRAVLLEGGQGRAEHGEANP